MVILSSLCGTLVWSNTLGMSIDMSYLYFLVPVTLFIIMCSVVTIDLEDFSFGMLLLWVPPLACTWPSIVPSIFYDRKVILFIDFCFSSFVRSFGWTWFHAVLSFYYFTSLRAPHFPIFPNFFSTALRLRACEKQLYFCIYSFCWPFICSLCGTCMLLRFFAHFLWRIWVSLSFSADKLSCCSMSLRKYETLFVPFLNFVGHVLSLLDFLSLLNFLFLLHLMPRTLSVNQHLIIKTFCLCYPHILFIRLKRRCQSIFLTRLWA